MLSPVEEKREISWVTIMSDRHAGMAMVISFWGTFNVVFFEGFMATLLVDLGMKKD